jgi:Cytochrome c
MSSILTSIAQLLIRVAVASAARGPSGVVLTAALVALSGCPRPTPPAAGLRTVKVAGTLVTLPEQGWSDADAEWFYTVSQGSQLIPYQWLGALQTADGRQSFVESIPQFGYIARKPSSDNPLGLPVGFVKDKGIAREWLGMNCSACHTNVIEYGDKSYLIDGAPTLADVQGLLTALSKALDATVSDAGRFERFAKTVLGGEDSPAKRDELMAELKYVAKKRGDYNARNMPKADATQFGFGRVDAIGAILNEVTVRFLDEPANHHAADGPVSYPFLWDTPYHDRVEWNGSAPNTIFDLGNLARNTGEVLGVFGDVEMPENAPLVGYKSTVQFDALREIEAKLKRLKSPLWPAEIKRPTDDAALAAKGKAHFAQHCAACHQFEGNRSRDDENRQIIAKLDDVGTDPNMARNFRERIVRTGKLENTKINFNPIAGAFAAEAEGSAVLVHVIIGAIVGGWKSAPPDELERLKQRPVEVRARDLENKYKGRPLNGIWATAPYLHNGSVPTLRDLLKPADQRPKTFWVGSRKFNAVDVGFESKETAGAFKFDTSLPGNLNTGHEYGTSLQPSEVEELLEYLKSL